MSSLLVLVLFHSNNIINLAVFGAAQLETSVFTDQVQFDNYSLILCGQRTGWCIIIMTRELEESQRDGGP